MLVASYARKYRAIPMPQGYFPERTKKVLNAFRQRAKNERHPSLLAKFPLERVATNLKNTWHSDGVRIYRNWLLYLSEQRREVRRGGRASGRLSKAPPEGRKGIRNSFQISGASRFTPPIIAA